MSALFHVAIAQARQCFKCFLIVRFAGLYIVFSSFIFNMTST